MDSPDQSDMWPVRKMEELVHLQAARIQQGRDDWLVYLQITAFATTRKIAGMKKAKSEIGLFDGKVTKGTTGTPNWNDVENELDCLRNGVFVLRQSYPEKMK